MRIRNRFFPILLLALSMIVAAAPALQAYRAVYLGSILEYNLNPYRNATDERLLYNAIRWAADKPGNIRAVLIPSMGADSYPSAWTTFDGLYPDITIGFITAKPLTLAAITASNADVMIISNAWHGPPAIVPAPNPGGYDWVYQASEQAAIASALFSGKGIIATGGSFGQFTYSGTAHNFQLAPLFGLASTGGGVPACANTLVWSRNSSVGGCTYPNTRTPSTIYNDAPAHPVMAGIPASYATGVTNACAQWMTLAGATQVAHFGGPAGQWQDSLITAYDRPPVMNIDLQGAFWHDGVFKGHPTVMYVTARNTGMGEIPLDASNLAMGCDAAAFHQEVLHFEMADIEGNGKLDNGGQATWVISVTLPTGPPDETFEFCPIVTYGNNQTATGSFMVSSDSRKNGNALEEYRHYQDAVKFIRCAWRNSDPRVPMALAALRGDTDDDFKRAKKIVANTSPGPGRYPDLIHENENEGNGQYGVSGR